MRTDELAELVLAALGDTAEETYCLDGEFTQTRMGRIVTGIYDSVRVLEFGHDAPGASAVLYVENYVTKTRAWVHMTAAQVRELFGDYSVVVANEQRAIESQVAISPDAFVLVVRQEGSHGIELTVEGWGGQSTVGLDASNEQRQLFYALGALVDADGLP